MTRKFSLLGILAVSVWALLLPTAAEASLIEIQLFGVNATYDGFVLSDATNQFGGNQDPLESDPLALVNFLVDGVLVGSLNSDIYADFAFIGLTALPVGGGIASAAFGGFFDLLTSASGWGIGLDFLSPFKFIYDGGTLSGEAWATSIVGQDLPFGLVADLPIRVGLFFDSLTNVTNSGGFLTGFDAAGDATITVPEPTLLLMFGTAAALGIRRRFRRPSR